MRDKASILVLYCARFDVCVINRSNTNNRYRTFHWQRTCSFNRLFRTERGSFFAIFNEICKPYQTGGFSSLFLFSITSMHAHSRVIQSCKEWLWECIKHNRWIIPVRHCSRYQFPGSIYHLSKSKDKYRWFLPASSIYSHFLLLFRNIPVIFSCDISEWIGISLFFLLYFWLMQFINIGYWST